MFNSNSFPILLHPWKRKSCQTLVPYRQRKKKKKKSYLNQVNDSLSPFCAFSSITLGPLVHPFLKGLISCWIIDWICNRFSLHCELVRRAAFCLCALKAGAFLFIIIIIIKDLLVNHFLTRIKWNNYYFGCWGYSKAFHSTSPSSSQALSPEVAQHFQPRWVCRKWS